ncbi:MAG TPA: AI-2E family transporter [Ilumatobacteraceae bacterium]|nr:AI-2E family transporter [Ilumatobacteraceae bacterium]
MRRSSQPGDASAVTPEINRRVRWAAAYSWRLLLIAALAYGTLWLVGELLLVAIPIAVALLLARALLGPTKWLERRGLPPALAATVTLLGFIVVISALIGTVGASVATEFDELGPTLSQGIDDIETWLVEDSPFDLDQQRLDELRSQAGDRLASLASSASGSFAASAVVAFEIVAGAFLSLVITFFLLKDRDLFGHLAVRLMPKERGPDVRALGERAWTTLGGYLRGVALLGIVEATVIGGAVWIVGGNLAGAVVVVTLLGAFVPIVGAIVAGVVAVLVTLVTAGLTPALIVAAVALVVQQLDNELLAPWIYGKSLQLHPLVILLGITAGTTLFGFVGALLAVPVLAVTLNVIDEARNPTIERHDGDVVERPVDLVPADD